jgi:S-formylglutathione hydrolase FrmB
MRTLLLLAFVVPMISTSQLILAEEVTTISPATTDADGFLVHQIKSIHQAGPTELRMLLPDDLQPEERFPVVFVLPVEAGRKVHYGDGLTEVRKHDLHNKYRAIFAAPTFFHLPWYIDHATDPKLQQETYFIEDVVSFVLKNYPASEDRSGRLLLGFSKSGWGAVSLLLRHPDLFERAAAWDAPFMMQQLGKYGTTPIFGSEAVLDEYELSIAIKKLAEPEQLDHRLIITGYGGFRTEHEQFHALLEARGVEHIYRDGPKRKHDWHSGWVAEAVGLLFEKPEP